MLIGKNANQVPANCMLGSAAYIDKEQMPVSAPQQAALVSRLEMQGAIGNINSPLLDLPLKNSLTMKAGVGSVTFTRASTATYIDRYGVLKYASIDEPRFEKDGMLIEGASTNLMPYSEDLTNPLWNKVGCTATIDGTLLGSIQATRLEETDTSSSQRRYYDIIAFDDRYGVVTSSMYVKPDSDRLGITGLIQTSAAGIIVDFNLDTLTATALPSNGAPTDITTRIESENDGVYRLSLSYKFTPDGDTTLNNYWYFSNNPVNGNATYTGEVGKGIWVGGFQVEALPFASSYIPTTDSAVTRGADVCNIESDNNLPSIERSVSVEFNSLGYKSYNGIFQFGTDNTFRHYIDSTNRLVHKENQTTISTSVGINVTDGNMRNSVSTLDSSGLAKSYIDGVYKGEIQVGVASFDTSLPICIGGRNDGVYSLYGHIKNFRIWDRSLTPTEVALA